MSVYFRPLRVLLARAGKVLTRKFLMNEVWGGATDVQYLRIQVRAPRQKLEPDPEQPLYILHRAGRRLPAARGSRSIASRHGA